MEERIIECRYERFLERANGRISTFIPNRNRLALAYRKSTTAKVGSSAAFAYRGSLLGTIRGQIAYRAQTAVEKPKNELENFELQPNFEKGKQAESKRYQDNGFLPNWRNRPYVKPQLAEEWEPEETKRLQVIQNSRHSDFLPRARRQFEVAMPALPLWNRNSWRKTVKQCAITMGTAFSGK
jgi:hypothetical protein